MIPKQLIIGDVPYNVEIVDGYVKETEKGVLIGEIEPDKQSIKLSNRLAENQLNKTLLHEIIHGILYESGMRRYDKEVFVESFTNALYNFLHHNDISFLQKQNVSKKDSDESLLFCKTEYSNGIDSQS